MTEMLGMVTHPVGVRVSVALLHFVWQGAALAMLALLVLAGLRRSSAQTRYAVLLAVFAAMALCPVVTIALSGEAASPATADAVLARAVGSGEQVVSTTLSPVNEVSRADGTIASAGPRRPGMSEWLRPALPWVSVLWLAGVVAAIELLLG